MRIKRKRRSRTLYQATLRRMLALGCAALLVLGSMLGSVVFVLTYRSSRKAAGTAVETAAENMNLWAASINNISSMIAYGNVAQQALEGYWRSGGTAEVENMHTLFASSGQYIRIINNFIVLDSTCSYYNSMFVVSMSDRNTLTDFIRNLPEERKNGRAFWYILPDGQAVLVRSIYSLNATMHTIGYLLITMDLEQLYSIARQYAFDESSRLYLLDSDGALLCGPDGADRTLPEGMPVHMGTEYTTVGGEAVLAAHSGTLSNGWVLVELTPQSAVFAGVFQLLGWSVLLFCLTMALFMLVMLYISRSLTAPFGKMRQAMEQIETGNFAIPSISSVGILEVDQLLQRFGQMAERLDQTVEEVYQSRLREKELALSAQQSEIEMLQQQINPHFLYNTLDSINWMASFGATEEVSRMIVALSDFFRFTVSEHSIFTTVGREVAFAKNYVYLQQCRFGMALQVHFDIDPEAENDLTLRLLLQPLIENAIVHGVMNGSDGGTVRIGIALKDGRLHLCIEDNGAGMDDATLQSLRETRGSHSIGLPNIIRRLELVYGERHSFSIDSAPGRGTRVVISFPAVRTEEELQALTGRSVQDSKNEHIFSTTRKIFVYFGKSCRCFFVCAYATLKSQFSRWRSKRIGNHSDTGKEKIMKKRVCALLLGTVMLVSLTACGGGGTSSGTSQAAGSGSGNSEEPVTITYYTWETAEENNPVWQEIEDELNIRVEVCILPDTGGTDKESALDIVAMSGSEMDFRIITETSPAQRIENGFAYNLDDLISEFDVDMEGLFGKYAEFVQYDGSYYGIPCRANIKYWFYNKDIFDELGLDYPQDGWTWDEYFELADQITEMSDYYGTSTNAHTGMWSYNGLMQGGQPFDENGNFVMYDDPFMLDALYQYKRMDDEGVKPSFVSMRSRNSYISTEFLAGNCAMAEGFPYILRDMRLPDQFPFVFEVGIVTPPVNNPGDTCYTCGGVQFLAINPGSEHKEEAFQAMVYYMEHGAEYMVNLSVPPVAEASDELIEAFVEGTPVSVEDGAKFFDPNVQFVKSNPYEDYPNGIDYQSIMNEEAEVYFTDGQDFDTAVANIRTRSEELAASAAAE